MKLGFQNMIRSARNKEKVKLKVDYTLHGLGVMKYSPSMELTEKSEEDLIAAGYLPVRGLIDNTDYWNVPVYLKMNNWKVYKIRPEDPQDTSFTLYDFWNSKTLSNFKKALSRLGSVSDLNIKVIGIVALVIVAVVGAFFLIGGGMNG